MYLPCQSQRSPRKRQRRGRTSRRTISRKINGVFSSISRLHQWIQYFVSAFMIHFCHVVRDDFHFVHVIALTPTRIPTKSRETRYFTEECLIPPLKPLDSARNASIYSDKIHFGALPVTYTNDPKTVSRWIADHIVDKTCTSTTTTIGFDLEVSLLHFIVRKAWSYTIGTRNIRALKNQNINQTRIFSCRETYSRQITITFTTELEVLRDRQKRN